MDAAPDEAEARPRGGPSKFGWAGFGLITLAAVSAFLVTAVSLGVLDDLPSWGVSGGLVSMVGGVYLSKKCRTWTEFWARVWIWMAAAALLAGLGVWSVSSPSQAGGSGGTTDQAPPSESSTPSDPEADRVKSRKGTDQMFKMGFGSIYRQQYKREATAEERDDAYEYALIMCEALDRGMSPKKLYTRMLNSKPSESEFMFFHMSFMAAVAQVCDEYRPAYDRYLDTIG